MRQDRVDEYSRTLENKVEEQTRDLLEANENLEKAAEEAIELARAASEANEAKSIFLSSMSHEIRSPMNGVRILLAEDNPVNRMLAQRILQKAGFALDCVENGREALEAPEADQYDLVLMDVQMPELDGFQATELIRKNGSERISSTPIVALTAHAMEDDRKRCLDSGMNDYIAKPIDPQRFIEVVMKWSGLAPAEGSPVRRKASSRDTSD